MQNSTLFWKIQQFFCHLVCPVIGVTGVLDARYQIMMIIERKPSNRKVFGCVSEMQIRGMQLTELLLGSTYRQPSSKRGLADEPGLLPRASNADALSHPSAYETHQPMVECATKVMRM